MPRTSMGHHPDIILTKLRHHLYGRRFTVWTDNMALKWLHSKRDVGVKLAQWILGLQEFDIDIKHLTSSPRVDEAESVGYDF